MNKRISPNPSGEFITVQQAAELTNLGINSVRRLSIEAGALKKIGKNVRVNRKKLFSYIDETFSF